MHIPEEIKTIYAATGPFATVYLDATRSTENGPHEVELRLRGLRSQLTDAGADEATTSAMEQAVLSHEEAAGPHGQLLVDSRCASTPRWYALRPGATLSWS